VKVELPPAVGCEVEWVALERIPSISHRIICVRCNIEVLAAPVETGV